jgi:hypothetical protein
MTLPDHPLRPVPGDYLEYFGRYIEKVPDGDLLTTLASQAGETRALLSSPLAEERADFRYAPGKWSLKEVVGHMADTERVMAYRALAFARGEQSPLPSFDEKSYTEEGRFGTRPLKQLVDDFAAARASTLSLFRGFAPEFWLRSGTASGARITVLALGFIVAGHVVHHRQGLLQNYLTDSGQST